MDKVLQIVATGVCALGTAWHTKSYEMQSSTPFRDDRRHLFGDYLRIREDLRKSINKVKSQDVSKKYGR